MKPASLIPQGLAARLLITYVTLMAVGIGGVIAWTGQRLADENIQQAEHELALQSNIIANALRDPLERPDGNTFPGGRSVSSLVTSYAQSIDGRVTLVDSQFNVVLSSDSIVPAGAPENDTELTAARAGSEQYEIRLDAWTKQERLFVAVPVDPDRRQPLGFVQLSVAMAPIQAAMQQTWVSLIGIASVILLLTVAASAVLARQIAIPVQSLTTTSEQIAAGRLDERVAPGGPGEIRRMGVAFNQMAERVQEMIGQQRAFVDNAAHELRTPLTSLRLRIEMLRSHGRNDPELTGRYLAQMERDVGFLQRLVDHLLALAAVEEGAAAPRVPLEPARLLHELADAMTAFAQQEGVHLAVDVPDHLTRLQANPEQMVMLVRNLLDNAIKYAHGKGTVTLAAREADGCLEISVSDTGSGIPAEALPHIFDRFYRVDRARSRQQGGVGLGLSLVRSIAEVYGGRVQVSSRVDEGSTFTVYLPIKSA